METREEHTMKERQIDDEREKNDETPHDSHWFRKSHRKKIPVNTRVFHCAFDRQLNDQGAEEKQHQHFQYFVLFGTNREKTTFRVNITDDLSVNK